MSYTVIVDSISVDCIGCGLGVDERNHGDATQESRIDGAPLMSVLSFLAFTKVRSLRLMIPVAVC